MVTLTVMPAGVAWAEETTPTVVTGTVSVTATDPVPVLMIGGVSLTTETIAAIAQAQSDAMGDTVTLGPTDRDLLIGIGIGVALLAGVAGLHVAKAVS